MGRYTFYDVNERVRKMPFYVHTFCEAYDQKQQSYQNCQTPHLLCVKSGHGGADCEGRHYNLLPGDFLLFCRGASIRYYPEKEGLCIKYISFGGFACDWFQQHYGFGQSASFRNASIEAALDDLLAAISRNIAEETVSAKLYALLTEMGLLLSGRKETDGLETALRYLCRTYLSDCSVRTLAEQAHLSESAFYQQFRARMETTPSAYRLALRMETAKHLLLAYPDRPVSQVAADSGFHSASYFVECFRRATGVTPRAFRRTGL